MTNNKTGGPAFPMPAGGVKVDMLLELWNGPQKGMTLLDYFAGQALQGMIAACSHQLSLEYNLKGNPKIPQYAYEFASAMLEERKKHLWEE